MPHSPSHRVPPIYLPLENTIEVSHTGPTKAFYISTILVLLPINLSTGLVAWFVQFFLPCSAHRLHILVALISQILLTNVCAIVLIYFLLHYLGNSEIVTGWRNFIVQLQIITVAFTSSGSFILLALAVLAGYVEEASEFTPIIGVILFCVMVIATLFVGSTVAVQTLISRKFAREKSDGPSAGPSFHPHAADLTKYQWRPLLVLSIVEIILFILLFVSGVQQAYSKPKYIDCSSGNSLLSSGYIQSETVTVAGSFPTRTIISTTTVQSATESSPSMPSLISSEITSVAGAAYVTITRTSTARIEVSTLPV